MSRVACSVVIILVCVSAFGAERVIDFNQYPLGQTPSGFQSTLSGGGKLGEWKVIADPGATGDVAGGTNKSTAPKVLAQLSQDGTDERFPMLIFEQEAYGDFTLTTRLKLVDGLSEQMAGIAFRIQDTNNYYYVRASALGKGSFRFISVVKGQRETPIGPEHEIQKGVWHDLVIDCKGNRMSFQLDGKQLFPSLTHNSFSAGQIGFWTKSDSVSYFGETRITYIPHETLAQSLVREAIKTYPRVVGIRIYAIRGEAKAPTVIASNEPDEVGLAGEKVEQEVITRDVPFAGKQSGMALVTLPLHDRNGEVAGAVRVTMQSFTGQTDQNILARAQPIVKGMEKRVRTGKDLLQ